MNIGRTNAYSVSNAAFNKQAAHVEWDQITSFETTVIVSE